MRPGASRDALLEGAIACLQERGYARTTARDITRASGANLAGIGYHFGSKDALLVEALGESCRRWVSQLGRVASAETDPRLWLESAELAQVFAANRGLCVAFVEALAVAQHDDRVRAQLAEIYRELRSGLGNLLEALGGANGAFDATAQASVLLGLVDGLLIQWLLDPGQVPAGDRILASLRAL